MKRWLIKYTQDAEYDLGFFLEKHPDIWPEIKRTMQQLAEEEDPRHPQNPELNVAMIEHDAPGWWRVYVGQRGPKWVRIVFLLRGVRGHQELEIERLDHPDEFESPKSIVITQVAFRREAYGKTLKTRYKRQKGD
jgi:hypothetical protein